MHKCWYCNNELTTGDSPKHFGICNKCYQETFGNNTSKFIDLLNTEMYELKISNLEYKLNEKDQRISKLEKQLKNSIRPKFKVGQEVWCIRFMKIIKFKINKIEIYRGESEEENRIIYGNWEDMTYQIEENCFATKAEAESKLRELQGEKK